MYAVVCCVGDACIARTACDGLRGIAWYCVVLRSVA